MNIIKSISKAFVIGLVGLSLFSFVNTSPVYADAQTQTQTQTHQLIRSEQQTSGQGSNSGNNKSSGGCSVTSAMDNGLSASQNCTQGKNVPTDFLDNNGKKGIINKVINIMLFIVGVLAVIMIIYGGILYTTAHGDKNQIEKAKSTLIYSIVGLIVAIIAYALVNWVTSLFTGSQNQSNSNTPPASTQNVNTSSQVNNTPVDINSTPASSSGPSTSSTPSTPNN